MIYLSCQPAVLRFSWEVEVYINNFISMGINPKDIHVVCGLQKDHKNIPIEWVKLKNRFDNVNFFFYEDSRELTNSYQPSIQSHLLHKHWQANPHLENETVFFHDSDFVFTKPLDFTPFIKDDIWYLSNTVSYIGASYIRSKGDEIFEEMCKIAKLDKNLVLENETNSGGAQKLIKKVPTTYWKQSFDLQLELWEKIPPLSKKVSKYKNEIGEKYFELQHWTMSMWSELWVAWRLGITTKIPKEFDFHFATDNIENWHNKYFYHNAGVTSENEGYFFKGLFSNTLPYGYRIPNPNMNKTGWKYYTIVQEVGKNSCLI